MSNPSQLAFLLAESGIRQLYGRYADAAWRQDIAAFRDCFAEDAVWKIAGNKLQGREAIGDFFGASLTPSERVMLWSGNSVIELGADAVTGRTQVTELIKRRDGSSLRTLAIYYDRFVEQDGIWRFQWHHFDMAYLGPTDLSAAYLALGEYGAPPAMPRDDDPTPAAKR